MSTLEVIGFFVVALGTVLFIAAVLIFSATGVVTTYRWARRGRDEEHLDVRDMARMKAAIEKEELR